MPPDGTRDSKAPEWNPGPGEEFESESDSDGGDVSDGEDTVSPCAGLRAMAAPGLVLQVPGRVMLPTTPCVGPGARTVSGREWAPSG
jgi:hypothetical protein